MKKSKGQNLLSPSSSWRENPHPHRRKSKSTAAPPVSDFGCLPSFFHLLFRNPRKSLTFGSKKREQRTVVCASPTETKSHAPPLNPTEESHAHARGEGETARMSLVGALEKCDRDLEELRRTIDVIKTTFFLHQKLLLPPPSTTTGDILSQKKTTEEEVDKDTTTKAKPNKDLFKTDFNVGLMKDNINIIPKRSSEPVVAKVRKSMVESVNQVCDDVAWGQRREIGRIGLALHDHICRDLINETVRELSFSFSGDFPSPVKVFCGGDGRHLRRGSTSLPLDACRRRLVFS